MMVVIQRTRELGQSLIKVVHLGKNADSNNDNEYICTRMRKLVFRLVASEGQFDSNSECFGAHDGQ